MAIAFRAAQGSNNAGGGTTIVMTVPAGVVDGDVLLMGLTVRGGTGTTITDPSGWTLIGSQENSTTVLAEKLYWRIASSEPASYTITITSNKASGVIIALSGADSGTPGSSQFTQNNWNSSTNFASIGPGTWASQNGIAVFLTGFAVGTIVQGSPTSYTEPTNGESASTGGGASSRTTTAGFYRALTAVTSEASIGTGGMAAAAVQCEHHVFIFEAATAAANPVYAYPALTVRNNRRILL